MTQINIPTKRKKTNVVSIASAKPKSTRKTADELLEWREMVMRRDELQHYIDKLDDYVAYHNLQDSDAGSILERAHEEMNYILARIEATREAPKQPNAPKWWRE